MYVNRRYNTNFPSANIYNQHSYIGYPPFDNGY